MKKRILSRLGDISRIHHRAAFADVQQHIDKHQGSSVFVNLASKRFSCREFNHHPVSSIKLAKILEAARLAPSAKNQQPVHVWALTSAEALERIRPIHTMFDAPVVIMVGFKAAGGIRTTEDAVKYYTIVKEVLGEKWLDNRYFRIGASSLANALFQSFTGENKKVF